MYAHVAVVRGHVIYLVGVEGIINKKNNYMFNYNIHVCNQSIQHSEILVTDGRWIYGALQTRSTHFFQIEEHSTERFKSELVMRFLTKKTKLLGSARDGLHELIDQKDPVAMYKY